MTSLSNQFEKLITAAIRWPVRRILLSTMSPHLRLRPALLALIFVASMQGAVPRSLMAQTTDRDLNAIASWVAIDAATGYETRVAPALAKALGEWQADRWGNVVSAVGSGSPHRIVACGLDRPSYAVTQITADGYLRVHRIGGGSQHPLWDQQFEAQQVRVLTKSGPVSGVVARSNQHFAPQHAREVTPVTADDLWIDVGAESRGEAEALGIALLDPVGRHIPPWPIAGAVTGPDAGRRSGCAAVVAVAETARRRGVQGRTTFVLSAQEVMGWVGLSAFLARGEPFHHVTVLAPGENVRVEDDRPVQRLGRLGAVLGASNVNTVRWLSPSVEQASSHMEILRATEAEWLLEAAARAAGVVLASENRWIAAPPPTALRVHGTEDAFAQLATGLTNLVERHAVSGHEWSVRRAVLEQLPTWARERAVVDDVGNVTVEAGPQGPATLFVAHMDEVGYVIQSIAADGTVTLAARGGIAASAWEGQTALVHFDPQGSPSMLTGSGSDTDPRWKMQSIAAAAPPPMRGVFRIRSAAPRRNPDAMQAWFGIDGAGLAARGVTVGMQVTSHKEGLRLGHVRYTGRSLDDRAGSTALLRAINLIDPDTLPGRVIFAWSVNEEEGGWRGATAMARRFGRTVTRVYSIDTFVTSDTPLESPHFAFASLGKGPVLRAIENSSVSPDEESSRVHRAAAAARIALQTGLTQGGTDGSAFTWWGAPNQGLSWPGRYSHSPGEALDLRDLDMLARLIVAVATTRE